MAIFREFIIFIFLKSFLIQFVWTIHYKNVTIKEETQANHIIGSIKDFVTDKLNSRSIIYKITSNFIQVRSSGDIVLQKQLDLDTLCQTDKMCCGTDNCLIQENIIMTNNKDYIDSLNLKLIIQDINDNEPKFSHKKQIVSFRESCPINYSISLESAIDNDFSKFNRILYYRFQESTNTFNLDTSNLPQISLRVSKPLDYEKYTQYKSTLEACDKMYCATKSIVIDIIDENDNRPVFEQKLYKKTLSEDLETGSLILTVTAKDADSGSRGVVFYAITTTDSDLKNTFGIESRSGQLRLERKLAANIRQYYSFYIVAQDNDPENPHKEKVPVELTVEDVNDHHPHISVLSVSDRIGIRENVHEKTSLCTIKVTDQDIGNNSLVHCSLDKSSENNFHLVFKSRNMYLFYPKRAFDFEKEQLLSAQINCTDNGRIPKSNTHNLLIHIIDVNEYKPQFKEPTYEITIPENSPSNKLFLRIEATDNDVGALIRYALDKTGSKVFKVDPKTGWIRTTHIQLDRETMETMVFSAYVTDAKVDPNTATTKVIVTIGDENDNAPVFGVIPKFTIRENQMSTRLIGRLTATDADKGLNGKVEFVLLKTIARQQELQRIFHVTADGYLETLQSLDRETFSDYLLEVGVRDMGQYPLATSVNLTVTVVDENDNQPQWLIPSPLDPVINITGDIKLGSVIMNTRAFDPDFGENGAVHYQLQNQYDHVTKSAGSRNELKENTKAPQILGSTQPQLEIDSQSGELRLVRGSIPNQHSYPPLTVVLVASDNGSPQPRSSTLRVTVVHHQSGQDNLVGGYPDDADTPMPSATVIVILIASIGFILMALVISIICVRKRPLSGVSIVGGVSSGHNTVYSSTKYTSCPAPLNHLAAAMTTATKSSNDVNGITPAEWNFQDISIYTTKQQQQQSQRQQQPLQQQQLQQQKLSPTSPALGVSTVGVPHHSVQLRNDLAMPMMHHAASSRTSYEPIDAEESGDSGKGPSEDTRNIPYLDSMFVRNYSNSLQWKIPSPIPSGTCNGVAASTVRQMYMMPPLPTSMQQQQPLQHQDQLSSGFHNNHTKWIRQHQQQQQQQQIQSPLSFLGGLPGAPPTANSSSSDAPTITGGNEINEAAQLQQFSLPRSPDYFSQSSRSTSNRHQSQVYDTPDGFNSELELSQMQQSNI